jgi:hypothetical protein
VDGDAMRAQIVTPPCRLRELQQADEHRRHPLAVGHAVLFDVLQCRLGIEVIHDHDGAAEAEHRHREVQRRGVVERRR